MNKSGIGSERMKVEEDGWGGGGGGVAVVLAVKLSDNISYNCLSFVSISRTRGASHPRLSAV